MAPPKKFETSLFKKEQVSKDAYSFYFKKPDDFAYIAGQYLRMTIPISNPDERGSSRFFTISSSPTENHLMITTRIIQSSFKKTLVSLTPEIPISILAPFGSFTLQQSENGPYIFLAGGIGVTPLRSMIRYAVDTNLILPITLITSFRTSEDIVFAEELREIAIRHSWLALIETVTRPEESAKSWTGKTGRIDASLIKENIKDPFSSLFYISGAPAMVDSLAQLVQSIGVNNKKIKVEKFSGY